MAVAIWLFALQPAYGQTKTPVGSWVPAASMPEARENFTATVLNDGRVLVAGMPSGAPGAAGDPAKSALLYDPVKNIWSQTASMLTPRSLHSATLLADGRVLVVGGGGAEGFVNTAELFDPAAGKWSPAASIGKTGRHWHTATLLKDGRVLVVGGRNQSHEQSYSDAWIYDPKANAWTETGSFETGRRSQTATLLGDGTVLIAGGQLGGHDPSLKDALIYDPATGVFKPVPNLMSAGRAGHTATLLPDGRVLIVGGSTQLVGGGPESILASAEIYEPKTQTFNPAGSASAPGYLHSALAIPGGVLISGGRGGGTPGNSKDEPLYVAETYAPKLARFAPAGALRALSTKDGDPLAYDAAVVLNRRPCGVRCGSILALGSNSAQAYTPARRTTLAKETARGAASFFWPAVAAIIAATGAIAGVAAVRWRRR